MAASDSSMLVIGEEKAELSDVPSGFKFSPLDTEIVVHLLKRKILNQQLPADINTTVDVYGNSPDQLPLSEFRQGVKNEWYVFTTKPKRNLYTRDGYWTSISNEKIFDGDGVIGFMQTLVFYRGKPPQGMKSNWFIYEYRVNPDIFAANELNDGIKKKISDFVLCKVVLAKDGLGKSQKAAGPEIRIPSSGSSADSNKGGYTSG